MTGTEVERVGTVGPPSAEGFVVGKVLSAEPHPDADRLRVCTVDTGDGERTIVCGAPNVAAGQAVAGGAAGGDAARRPGDRQGEAARGRVGRDDLLRRRAWSWARAPTASSSSPTTVPVRLMPPITTKAHRKPGAGDAAGRGAADCRAGAGAGGDAEPGRLLRRLRRRPRGARDQRRAARRGALGRGRGRGGRGRGRRLRLGHGRGRPISAPASPPASSPM